MHSRTLLSEQRSADASRVISKVTSYTITCIYKSSLKHKQQQFNRYGAPRFRQTSRRFYIRSAAQAITTGRPRSVDSSTCARATASKREATTVVERDAMRFSEVSTVMKMSMPHFEATQWAKGKITDLLHKRGGMSSW